MNHPRAVRILYRTRDAWDCERGSPRTFALCDVIAWQRPQEG